MGMEVRRVGDRFPNYLPERPRDEGLKRDGKRISIRKIIRGKNGALEKNLQNLDLRLDTNPPPQGSPNYLPRCPRLKASKRDAKIKGMQK